MMDIDGTENELALICAAREGDKDALNALLRCHWTWLKALVYGVLADAGDLDDVMQDVCLRVVTRIHTLREPECFRPWLAILARREAIKHFRGNARRTEVMADSAPTVSAGPIEPGPLESLLRKDMCQQILTVVKALPEKYREVFMLAHSGQLSYAQMAEVLDVPATTMQIRLVRARRMVQNQLIDQHEQEVYER